MKFFIITLFTYYFYNILKYRKGLYMLQQNIYNEGNRYLKWTLKNKEEVFFNYDLLSFLLILLTFFVSQTFYMIAIIIFFLVLSYKELNKISKEQKKIKFKVTSRIKRIIMTISLIFILINLPIVINYNIEYEWIYFLIMFTFTYLSYYIVYLANIINKPIEKMVYYHFYNKAKKKVIEMNNLKVIGVNSVIIKNFILPPIVLH